MRPVVGVSVPNGSKIGSRESGGETGTRLSTRKAVGSRATPKGQSGRKAASRSLHATSTSTPGSSERRARSSEELCVEARQIDNHGNTIGRLGPSRLITHAQHSATPLRFLYRTTRHSPPVSLPLPTSTMQSSFASSFRASARRAAFSSARVPKGPLRSAYRKYSTEPEAPKSKTGLYAGIGALAVGGGLALYFYSSSPDTLATSAKSGAQAVKVAANFVPTKEDYQKVRAVLSRMS